MNKHSAIFASTLLAFACLGRAATYELSPQSVQGNSGEGWYVLTGKSVYSPDGHLAWEFRDPYDTEPVWMIFHSQPEESIPSLGLVLEASPYAPQSTNTPDEVLWKLVWKTTPDEVPTWAPATITPVIIGDSDSFGPEPIAAHAPEPSSFLLLAASTLLGAKLLKIVKKD